MKINFHELGLNCDPIVDFESIKFVFTQKLKKLKKAGQSRLLHDFKRNYWAELKKFEAYELIAFLNNLISPKKFRKSQIQKAIRREIGRKWTAQIMKEYKVKLFRQAVRKELRNILAKNQN